MENRLCSIGISIIFFISDVLAVPPEACFANFRWDDCGKPPVPVMYYWKPGSRCEVGLWRGCLPNLNMFQDEYECVSTCVFSVRAMPDDYHNLINAEDDEVLVTSPPINIQSDITEDAINAVGDKEDTTPAAGDDVTSAAPGGASAGSSPPPPESQNGPNSGDPPGSQNGPNSGDPPGSQNGPNSDGPSDGGNNDEH